MPAWAGPVPGPQGSRLLETRARRCYRSGSGPGTRSIPLSKAAFEQIEGAIRAKEFRTFLLHGVTGSGKTEVYLKRHRRNARRWSKRLAAGS